MRLLLPLFLTMGTLFAIPIPKNALYLEGASKQGIILAHGRGMHPNFKVVKPLRISLHEDLDFHTLSLQMPTNHQDYQGYETEQPKVHAMIEQSIRFLQAKGVTTIYLMGHSLGAGMTSGYLVSQQPSDIAGYIVVGCRGNKSAHISCQDNMTKITIPVFDVWGRGNESDETFAQLRKPLISPHYTQYGIEGANHVLDGADGFFVDAVEEWLEAQ